MQRRRSIIAELFASAVIICGLVYPTLAAESNFYTKLKSGANPKIMIIGNSTSQEYTTNVCNTTVYVAWPKLLKAALDKIGTNTLVATTCAGRHSGNFIDGSDGFAKSLAWVKTQKPDAVIIEFAPGADCVSRFNITVAQSKANHIKIIDGLLAANPAMEIFFWTGARSYGTKWTDRESRVASKETQPDYAAMYVQLATEKGQRAVDTYTKFLKIYTEQGLTTYKTYMKDENHTNAKAATEIIVPEILAVMKGEASSGGTPAPLPALTLLSPVDGARFTVGSTMSIKWNYNPDSVSAGIEISYSPDGKSYLSVASAVDVSKKEYVWTIPESITDVSIISSTSAKIRINEYDRDNYRYAGVTITPVGSEPIIIDNTSSNVQFVGTWTTSSSTNGSDFNGNDYRHDGDEGKGQKEAIFTTGLTKAGNYSVYMQWASNTNRATNVPVVIKTTSGDKTVTVDQQQKGGEWNLLGAFNLGTDSKITIQTTNTIGHVIADAIKLEYIGPATSVHNTSGAAMRNFNLASASRVTIASSGIRIPQGTKGLEVLDIRGRTIMKISELNGAREVVLPAAVSKGSVALIRFVQ